MIAMPFWPQVDCRHRSALIFCLRSLPVQLHRMNADFAGRAGQPGHSKYTGRKEVRDTLLNARNAFTDEYGDIRDPDKHQGCAGQPGHINYTGRKEARDTPFITQNAFSNK